MAIFAITGGITIDESSDLDHGHVESACDRSKLVYGYTVTASFPLGNCVHRHTDQRGEICLSQTRSATSTRQSSTLPHTGLISVRPSWLSPAATRPLKTPTNGHVFGSVAAVHVSEDGGTEDVAWAVVSH